MGRESGSTLILHKTSYKLNPVQDRDEQDQGENIHCPDGADGDKFVLYGFHVKHPEGSDEEGQVADQEDEPGSAATPPGIIPSESAN